MTTTEVKQIASTILSQLGGNKFIAMTGCKNFTLVEKENPGFVCQLTRNRSGAQYMKITLNSMDTYDIQFYKVHPNTLDIITVKECEGVYDDMLQEIFTDVTGLYTRL